jgi:hypothetical protein
VVVITTWLINFFLKLLLEVRNKKTGMVIYKVEEPLCGYFKKEKMVVPDIIKNSNIPPEIMTDLCPFPKGKYWVKNVVLDEKKFAAFPPGKYTGRLTLLEHGKALAAIEVSINLSI